jgi:hypothetical protein
MKSPKIKLSPQETAVLRKCASDYCFYPGPEHCRASSDPNDPKYCDNYEAMVQVWGKIRGAEAFMRWTSLDDPFERRYV